jgi:hypothetical protein
MGHRETYGLFFWAPRIASRSGESALPWAEAFGHPGHAFTLAFGDHNPVTQKNSRKISPAAIRMTKSKLNF